MNSFCSLGKEFSTHELFFHEFRKFCDENHQPFIITTNNKKQITLHCRHGIQRSSTSTGKRQNLRYNYLACTAKITCFKPANSTIVRITSVNLDHNHEISKAAFGVSHLEEIEKSVIGEKLYTTSSTGCDCTFHHQNQSPCRHIIFTRENSSLPIFDLSCFHDRYHKRVLTENFIPVDIGECTMEEFSEEATGNTAEKVLNSREKYNLILPVLLNIASIVSSHGTDQFKLYLNSMKEIESIVRAGKAISSMHAGNNDGGVAEKENRDESETEITTPTQEDNISVPSKFQNFQFKTKVKCIVCKNTLDDDTIITECCSTEVHENCIMELITCPSCFA